MFLKNLLLGVWSQKEVFNYLNISLSYESLPKKTNALVFNHDGINFIIINKNLSYFRKKESLFHEIAHIELNQLCQIDKDLFAYHIDKYEDEASKYIIQLREDIKKEKSREDVPN